MSEKSSIVVASIPRSDGILIVDDDRSVRAVVARILERAGYFVAAPPDSAEALRIWADLGPLFGLVITDLCSIGMSGHALIKQLAARGATIPVLVVSSRIYEQQIRDIVAVTLVDFMAKPFTHDDLLGRVRMLMQLR